MTIMLQLSDGCWVNALEISEITIDSNQRITVRMKNGIGHKLDCGYGLSAWTTVDQLNEKINHAVQTYSGKVEHAEPKFKPS